MLFQILSRDKSQTFPSRLCFMHILLLECDAKQILYYKKTSLIQGHNNNAIIYNVQVYQTSGELKNVLLLFNFHNIPIIYITYL